MNHAASAATTASAPDPTAFIDFLVRCDALRFGDFIGKSGRHMPYFVDFGQVRTGRQLHALGRFYATAIAATFGHDVDLVFGPAYKGIPLAVAAGTSLAVDHGVDVRVSYDRKEAKDHGEGGRIVGAHPTDGDRVVLVEDVTTAGTSVRATVPLLRSFGDVEVVGLVVGIDRRERGSGDLAALEELGGEFGLDVVALATIDDIVDHLSKHPVDGRYVIGEDDLERIAAYRAEHGPRA